MGKNMDITKILQVNSANYKPVIYAPIKRNNLNTGTNDFVQNLPLSDTIQHHLIHKACFVTLEDSKGNKIPATIINNKRNKSMYLKRGKEDLGGLTYSICDAQIKGENYPDYYKNKKYLFINSIYSHQKYKGIGTALIKKVVEESKKRGYEGRVCLNTTTTKPEKGSPIPFYYKLGFECTNKQKDIEIKKALKEGKKIPPSCEAVTLFLPQKAINKLLEYW